MASIRRLVVSLVVLLGSTTISFVQAGKQWEKLEAPARVASFPPAFQQAPPEPPEYMVDNTGNKRGVAPNKGRFSQPMYAMMGSAQASSRLSLFLSRLARDDRRLTSGAGKYNGPVWRESGSFEGYMKKLAEKKAAGLVPNSTTGGPPIHTNSSTLKSRQGGSFWLPTLGPLGKVRNVWFLVYYPHSTWQLAAEELDVPNGFAPEPLGLPLPSQINIARDAARVQEENTRGLLMGHRC